MSDLSMQDNAHAHGITRYGVTSPDSQGGLHMPYAHAVAAHGWIYVSGQLPMENGMVIEGNIIAQSHRAIRNLISILSKAGCGPEHVVRCGVWLSDPRDFAMFNKVFQTYFGEHPPARVCVNSSLVIDAKIEIDCIAYKEPDSKT